MLFSPHSKLLVPKPHGFVQGNFTADEILPNLWQGSVPNPLVVQEMGVHTVVLCAEEYQPAPAQFQGVELLYAPNEDDFSRMPTKRELEIAFTAGRKVAHQVTLGNKVLVTCWMGWNRSGLVSAFALHFLTKKPGAWCARVVKFARQGALQNPGFNKVLNRLRAPQD